MAKVHYTLHVPSSARHVTYAAHHYLTSGTVRGINHANVQFGHPYDALTAVGEDSPELDSHIKQTGTFIGEVANAPVTNITKHNGKNIVHWTMRNPFYQAPPSGGAPQLFGPSPVEMPLPSTGPRPQPTQPTSTRMVSRSIR